MIASLEEQKRTIEKENIDLREKIAYFETDYFREKTAKERLNMQKQDEKVAVVKFPVEDEEEQKIEIAQKEENESKLSNYQKWFGYFFSYEQ